MSRTVASLATSVRSLRCWSEANDGPRERPSAPRERALDAEGGEELDRRGVGAREEVVRVEDVVGGDRRRSDTARGEGEDRGPVPTARATAQPDDETHRLAGARREGTAAGGL